MRCGRRKEPDPWYLKVPRYSSHPSRLVIYLGILLRMASISMSPIRFEDESKSETITSAWPRHWIRHWLACFRGMFETWLKVQSGNTFPFLYVKLVIYHSFGFGDSLAKIEILSQIGWLSIQEILVWSLVWFHIIIFCVIWWLGMSLHFWALGFTTHSSLFHYSKFGENYDSGSSKQERQPIDRSPAGFSILIQDLGVLRVCKAANIRMVCRVQHCSKEFRGWILWKEEFLGLVNE